MNLDWNIAVRDQENTPKGEEFIYIDLLKPTAMRNEYQPVQYRGWHKPEFYSNKPNENQSKVKERRRGKEKERERRNTTLTSSFVRVLVRTRPSTSSSSGF